jgi:magnesium-transporting ATPase (P-type)
MSDTHHQIFKEAGMEVSAVGDGANDELMIREAHCGIGIGTEPTADTKAFSDRQATTSCTAARVAIPSHILTDRKFQHVGTVFVRAMPASAEQ